MLKTLKLAAVAGTLALSAGAASAATISFTGGTGGNAGTVVTGSDRVAQNLFSGGLRGNVDFIWDATSPAYLAYSEFTVDREFSLTFDDYSPNADYVGTNNEKSGFQLYQGAYSSGALTAQLGSDTCGSDVSAEFGSTQCVFVTGPDNVGTTFTTPSTKYGNFAAGTYVLMFSEGNNPNNGSAEFIISAVPVPAAGFLLMGALAGFGALRRRKKA